MHQTTAVLLILFSAFMWGSWGQFVKRTGEWPLRALMALLYCFSFVLTFMAMLIVKGPASFASLFAFIVESPMFLFNSLIGGILFSCGVYLYMQSISKSGMAFTYIVYSSISIVMGTVSSAFAGGMPADTNLTLVVTGCCMVLFAVVTSIFTQGKKREANDSKADMKRRISSILLASASGLLTCAYPLFTTLVMKSPIKPVGLDTFECMFLFSIGSLIAALFTCIIPLYRKKELKKYCVKASGLQYIFAILCAVCHYGGNIIHGLAAPEIGMALSWPLGQTMVFWGIFWGIVYGEYKNTTKRAVLATVGAVVLMAVGVITLAYSVYL